MLCIVFLFEFMIKIRY